MLAAAGHRFEIVNIGGGLPVSYMTQSEWDEILSRIRDGFLAAKRATRARSISGETRFVIRCRT